MDSVAVFSPVNLFIAMIYSLCDVQMIWLLEDVLIEIKARRNLDISLVPVLGNIVIPIFSYNDVNLDGLILGQLFYSNLFHDMVYTVQASGGI